MEHPIRLKNYQAIPDGSSRSFLDFGTYDSYGIEKLTIIRDSGWEEANITVVFISPSNRKTKVILIPGENSIDVPPEAISGNSGRGKIVFSGKTGGARTLTTDLEYLVRDHSKTCCADNSSPITPSVEDQFFEAVNETKKIAQSVRDDADNGKFDGVSVNPLTNLEINDIWNQVMHS